MTIAELVAKTKHTAEAEADGKELARWVAAMDAEAERTRAIFEEAYEQVARIAVATLLASKLYPSSL